MYLPAVQLAYSKTKKEINFSNGSLSIALSFGEKSLNINIFLGNRGKKEHSYLFVSLKWLYDARFALRVTSDNLSKVDCFVAITRLSRSVHPPKKKRGGPRMVRDFFLFLKLEKKLHHQ